MGPVAAVVKVMEGDIERQVLLLLLVWYDAHLLDCGRAGALFVYTEYEHAVFGADIQILAFEEVCGC